MAPAQPPRAAGRAAIDAARAAAKLLRGRLSASAGAREGALRILLSGMSSRRSPDAACLFSASPLLARLPPAALGVPPWPLPAPSRRFPLRDFVATKRRGCAPNKGTRAPGGASACGPRGCG